MLQIAKRMQWLAVHVFSRCHPFGILLVLLGLVALWSTTTIARAQDIERYCRESYGTNFHALALDANSAFSWRCASGSQQLGINVEGLCHTQFGPNYHAKVIEPKSALAWRCVAQLAQPPAPQPLLTEVHECNTDGVLGYPAEPNTNCVQSVTTLGPSSYAYTHDPPCEGDFAEMAASLIVDEVANLANTAASKYPGPIGGFVAGLVADHQARDILGKLNVASTNAMCSTLCVRVPPNQSIVAIRGMARDNESQKTYCLPGHPSNECAPGWSNLTGPTRSTKAGGTIVCSIAKNWSHDRTRDFALFVYYQ
jgi:hypothetical protein